MVFIGVILSGIPSFCAFVRRLNRVVQEKSSFIFAAPMSIQQENRFQAIIAHAKEYGFVFPSSEIYDGLSAVYDYGPYGSEL